MCFTWASVEDAKGMRKQFCRLLPHPAQRLEVLSLSSLCVHLSAAMLPYWMYPAGVVGRVEKTSLVNHASMLATHLRSDPCVYDTHTRGHIR